MRPPWSLPSPPSPSGPRPWAADPRARLAFTVSAPIVVLLTGLAGARAGVLNVTAFLLAYPLIAGGLVTAVLWWARDATDAWERGEAPPPPSTKGIAALGVAVVSLMLAMAASTGGLSAWIAGTTLVLGALVGFGVPRLPRRVSPLLVVVPVAVLSGGAIAGLFAAFTAIWAIWRSEPDHTSVLLVWLLVATFTMAAVGSEVGRISGNRMTPRLWWWASVLTAAASALCYALAMRLLLG